MSENAVMQPRWGDIFYADLRDTGCDAQRGCRPVVVIQNNVGNANSNSVIVAVVTSAPKKPMPTHVKLNQKHGLKMESTAILEDIVTIQKDDLSDYLGTVINTEAESQLSRAIKISLGV